MGASCSVESTAEYWAHLATKEEVRTAVRSFETWQKMQDQNRAMGQAYRDRKSGSLLQRVGGLDVVKQVVESFYRKLYSNKRLLVFLHDKDIVYLRAKQTLFMSWLFGPPYVPYTGRNVRIAHLRLIKERGFDPEDFDLGMEYFEQAMRELDAPDSIVNEVMRKVRPFRDAIFTPCEKDAEEEARWAFEERLKKEHLLHSDSKKTASMDSDKGAGAAAAAAAASGPFRGPQCPFTAGSLSRGASAAAAGMVSDRSSGEVLSLPSPVEAAPEAASAQCPYSAGRLLRDASAGLGGATSAKISGKIHVSAPAAPLAADGSSSGKITTWTQSQSRPRTHGSSGASSVGYGDGPSTPDGASAAGVAPAAAAAAAAAASVYLPEARCGVIKAADSAVGAVSASRVLQPQTSRATSRPSSAAAQPQTPDKAVPGPAASAGPQSQNPSVGSRPASLPAAPQPQPRPASSSGTRRPPSAATQSRTLDTAFSPAASAAAVAAAPPLLQPSASEPRYAADAAALPPHWPPTSSEIRFATAASQPPAPSPAESASKLTASAAVPEPQLSPKPVSSRPGSVAPPAPVPGGPFAAACDQANLAAATASRGAITITITAAAAAAAAGPARPLSGAPLARQVSQRSGVPSAGAVASLRQVGASSSSSSFKLPPARPLVEADMGEATAVVLVAMESASASACSSSGRSKAAAMPPSAGAVAAPAAAVSGGGGFARRETSALAALEMAAEMGLADALSCKGAGRGSGFGKATAEEPSAVADIVDAFLTEEMGKDEKGKRAEDGGLVAL